MPLTPDQMMANPWGTLGQPTSNYDIQRTAESSGINPTYRPQDVYDFTVNGVKYARGGAPWESVYGGNNTQFFSGDPSTYGAYDPQYGYGLRADIAEKMRQDGVKSNNSMANQLLTMAPLALGMLGTGAALGGLFPGIDAAGNALSAGNTGILSGWGGAGGGQGVTGGGAGGQVAGGLPDSYWSMMADAGGVSDAAGAAAGSMPGQSVSLFGDVYGGLTGGTVPEWMGGAGAMGSQGGMDAFMQQLGQNATTAAGPEGWVSQGIANSAATGGAGGSGNFLSSIANALGLGSGPGSGLSALGLLTSGLGGIGQAIASNTAANTAADAQNNATQAQLGMFNTINQQQAPYRQAGYNALGSIMGGMGLGPATGGVASNQFTHQFSPADLQTHLAPNYEFMRDQGLRATTNQLNKLGGMASGNTMQGINDYAMNYAQNAYQNAFNNYQGQQTNIFNRLNSIAGLGQTANAATGQAGAAMSGGIANSITGAGNALAAGQMGVGNALTNAGNNAMGWYALPQLLNWSRNMNG